MRKIDDGRTDEMGDSAHLDPAAGGNRYVVGVKPGGSDHTGHTATSGLSIGDGNDAEREPIGMRLKEDDVEVTRVTVCDAAHWEAVAAAAGERYSVLSDPWFGVKSCVYSDATVKKGKKGEDTSRKAGIRNGAAAGGPEEAVAERLTSVHQAMDPAVAFHLAIAQIVAEDLPPDTVMRLDTFRALVKYATILIDQCDGAVRRGVALVSLSFVHHTGDHVRAT